MKKTVTFTVNYTLQGVTVTKEIDGHKTVKRFRKGYAGLSCKADNWIHEQINNYREGVAIDGICMPEFIIIGHTLSKRMPNRSELISMIRRLVALIEEKCDATDINSDCGKLCEEAEWLISPNIRGENDIS